MAEESTVSEESEFEAVFNEIADKDGSLPTELDELPEVVEEDPIKANEGTPGDEPPKDEPKEVADDIYAGMNDTAKEYWKNLEKQNEQYAHRINSDDGRVRAYQKQAQDFQTKLKDIEESGNGPTGEEIANAMKGGSESWNTFSKEYPEIAQVLDERSEQAGKAMQEAVDNALAPVQQKIQDIENKEALQAEITAAEPVAEEFPEWKAEVKTKDYSDWFVTQPPGIKALGESSDPNDAVALIGLFDNAQVANGKPSIRKTTTPDPGVENTAEEIQQKTEAEKLKERREQQLIDGTAVKSKSAKIDPNSDVVDAFDQAFDFYASKKEKQA